MRALIIARTQLTDKMTDLEEEFGFEADWNATSAQGLAEFAGRLCYKSWGKPNPATASNSGYVSNIIDHKHFSVLEHGTVTFYIDGVSRNLTHELVRHRHFSFSQVSQRYVNESDSETICPKVLNPTEQVLLEDAVSMAHEAYDMILESLIDRGISGKKARQAARAVLPGSTETAIVVTGNHRSWREFIDKRYSEFADPEIRDLAQLVLNELRPVAPDFYADFPDKEF